VTNRTKVKVQADRLRIKAYLASHGPAFSTDVAEESGLSHVTTRSDMQHLGLMLSEGEAKRMEATLYGIGTVPSFRGNHHDPHTASVDTLMAKGEEG